ncbi:electron transfer flavoprotein subunit beta/FixA family protein [Micrococcales bacterium 31B]|nr:electron transfer flavoprotein subunit beta/FixA family protein [Micrococcales bacterium 31B]
MRILVCVKQLPDYQGVRQFNERGVVDRDAADGILNELDEYAVEAAVRLVEQHGGETIALTVGRPDATGALRKALQLGVDRALLVTGDEIVGSDALATSRVLAAAVRHAQGAEPFDLILCGMSATDSYMGVIPSMLAERLDLPALIYGTSLTLSDDLGTATITRTLDSRELSVTGTLPAVVSLTDQAPAARLPGFKAILAAKQKEIEKIEFSALGLPAGLVGLQAARAKIGAAKPLPERAPGELLKDVDGSSAARIAQALIDHAGLR